MLGAWPILWAWVILLLSRPQDGVNSELFQISQNRCFTLLKRPLCLYLARKISCILTIAKVTGGKS